MKSSRLVSIFGDLNMIRRTAVASLASQGRDILCLQTHRIVEFHLGRIPLESQLQILLPPQFGQNHL